MATRRETDRKAQRKRSAESQHVTIPKLSTPNRRKRKQLESDPEAWIWEMCGPKSGLENPLTRRFTSADQCIIGDFARTVEFGGGEFTVAARGGAKTTHLRNCIAWGLSSGKIRFEIYFCENETKAHDTQEYIQHLFEEGERMLLYYPEICLPVRHLSGAPQAAGGMKASGYRVDDQRKSYTNARLDFQWSKRGIRLPNVPGSAAARARLLSYGLDKPPRGLNKLGARPDHCSIDDPDNPKTKNNGELAQKVINFINLDIGGLGGEGRNIGVDILCTMSHTCEGVAYRLSDEESPFVVRKHPLMTERPQRMDLWQKYMKLRQKGKLEGDQHGREAYWYYIENEGSMNAGAKISNPHRFDSSPCPDGSPKQSSAIQAYFDDWSDKGERFVQCELDCERIVPDEDELQTSVTHYHVSEGCSGNLERNEFSEDTEMVVAGVDVRRSEIHNVKVSSGPDRNLRVVDYDALSNRSTSEHEMKEIEGLIQKTLHRMWDDWGKADRMVDLMLIDVNWVGSWKEDGQTKTWAVRPVEKFCTEVGIRKAMPARAIPRYSSPAESREVLIGDHWHILKGKGKDRRCHTVHWDKIHWSEKVQERLLIKGDSPLAIELFKPAENHDSFASHIVEGLDDFYARLRSPNKRKNYAKDHWFDSLSMALVAQSVEKRIRERSTRRRPQRTLAQMQKDANG